MLKVLHIIIMLLAPLFIFGTDFEFESEISPIASDFFTIQYDVVELKNYVKQDFLIRFLDDKRGLIAPEEIKKEFINTSITPFYDHGLPAAQGALPHELGYLRIQLPKGYVAKEFTIIIFLASKDSDGSFAKAKDFLNGTPLNPVAQFTIQANPNRKRCTLSIERPNGKIALRAQKGRKNRLGEKTLSGIPKTRNVKNKDIGKNVAR